jgi:hypothetical protein
LNVIFWLITSTGKVRPDLTASCEDVVCAGNDDVSCTATGGKGVAGGGSDSGIGFESC